VRIVAVLSEKGGVGKTTVTMNLAAVVAQASRVLVVDVDPQGSSGFWADQAGDGLPFDVADDTDPANLAQLRRLPYDVVFVDTPGNLSNSDVLSTVLKEADFAILPTEPAALAVPPLVKTIRQLVEPAGVDYRVLVNKVDPRILTVGPETGGVPTRAGYHETAGLLDQAGLAHFRAHIREYKIHKDAPIDGRVVTQYRGDQSARSAADDFKDVALELNAYWANTAAVEPAILEAVR